MNETKGKLIFACPPCQRMLPFAEALLHQEQTGHAVELYQEQMHPFFPKLFLDKYRGSGI